MNTLHNTRRNGTIRAGLLLAIFLSLISPRLVLAASGAPDMSTLVHETQKLSKKPNVMRLVWWIPDEFWQASLANNPSVSKESVEQLVGLLHPYVVVAVVDGKVGPVGGVTYIPASETRESILLVDRDGKSSRPIAEDKISPDAKNLIAMLKPVFSNMLGSMGENMHLVLFPAEDEGAHRVADAKKTGSFSVRLGDEEFKWQTPLGSLLPEKSCPVDGEKMNGAWKYCPWHGKELQDDKN